MVTAKVSSDYLGVVSPQEIEQLQKSLKPGARHALLALALDDSQHQVGANTETAARAIFPNNEVWLRALKPRLLDNTDTANASNALGEIRAYGSLLETTMSVNPAPAVPSKKVQPEFEVNAGDGPAIVEVHSRQLDPTQAKALQQFHLDQRQKHQEAVAKDNATGKRQTITTGAIGIIPFGAPNPEKPGDSVLTNVISRVCGIKNSDKQVDSAKPFILWLDLQDPLVWGYLSISNGQLVPFACNV